ncbi:MAG TPA: GGDEF domain-containing protein [Burkholderiales bacterium]|nr:GGDEF domain-containing protein [Burkholderiales bacterium]
MRLSGGRHIAKVNQGIIRDIPGAVEGLPRILRPIAVPAAIILAAALARAATPALPQSLSGLTTVGPYVVLILGAAISAWFNRGRALIMLVSLLAAFAGYSLAMESGSKSFAMLAVSAAFAIIVPFNVLLASWFPDGGVRQHRNYRWLLLGLAEILIVLWIAYAGRSSLSGTAWRDVLGHPLLSPDPIPLAAQALIAAAFVAAVLRAWPRRGPKELRKEPRPVDIGIAAALVAFFVACWWRESVAVFSAFIAAAGVILLVAVLQESHRLAFRDELTNLPSRRALEERIAGLPPRYAIAMVDVDHFKQFNDAHGHHVGDQVLKLVAARLARIEGGGVSYRYGGEEFCVLFPERTLEESWPHLEKLRKDIEDYRIAVRGGDRPRQKDSGSRLRAARAPEKTLSVTVSVGAAERDDTLIRPLLVIRAADEALYRAKRAGRNRVMR